MTQDRTDMRVLRSAPDAQDVTPTQRACEHTGDRMGHWGRLETMCMDCYLWINPEGEA